MSREAMEMALEALKSVIAIEIYPSIEILRAALAEAPKAEAVVNQELTTEPAALSDDDIEAIWFDTVRDMPRGSTNQQIRYTFARAVLAHGRKV